MSTLSSSLPYIGSLERQLRAVGRPDLYHRDFFASHPAVPIAAILIYFIMVRIFSPSRKSGNSHNNKKEKGLSLLDKFVAFHNFVMCVFSFVVLCAVAPPIYRAYSGGYWHAVHPGFGMEWKNVAFWSWLFYMSKYYEFIDTAILIVKGSRPGGLQVYHHMGAVIGMYVMLISHSPASSVWLGLNAFIHTLMYAYFLAASLGIRLNAVKPFITSLQIVQFFAGNYLGLSFYWVPGSMTDLGYFSITFNAVYTQVLILLFARFFYESYVAKPASATIHQKKLQ